MTANTPAHTFPPQFRFGTSTSAAQIETAVGHDWEGFRAMDGSVFSGTTRHEQYLEEDLDIIRSLAPNYRMSLMWSKLQHEPFAPLEVTAVRHYHRLFRGLQDRKVSVMLVLHHFANPNWFAALGGWSSSRAVAAFLDYINRILDEFGEYPNSFNTFNEPNIYVTMAHLLGQFPPLGRNPVRALLVLSNMGEAHRKAVQRIRLSFPEKPVGVSVNTALLEGENFVGKLPAAISDWWYHEFLPSRFEEVDFFGMSYYARIGYDPLPLTMLNTPDKIKGRGRLHDDMWEYCPAGLGQNIRRFWDRYKLPVIITENGICTQDDHLRIKSIQEYLQEVMKCIGEGIDVQGYYHWSAWDNFEWNLGNTFRFGLYEVNPVTLERRPKASAEYYSGIAHSGVLSEPTQVPC